MSRKFADRIAAMRAGNWQAMSKPKKAKRPPFDVAAGRLAGDGYLLEEPHQRRPVLHRAGLVFSGLDRVWPAHRAAFRAHSGGGVVPAVLAVCLGVMSLLYGPAVLRHDFRQDLRVADVLKLYPMPGWQVVLGEILAPAAILAGAQWVLLLLAFLFCPASLGGAPAPVALRLSVALSAALVMPCVDFIALLLPNAAALIFPAWVQLGKDTPRGFETMGQQLILMFGQIIVLILSILPAAAAGTLAYLLAWWLFGKVMALAVVAGALAVVAVLIAEAALGVILLGKTFDRFDWSEGSGE